MATWQFTCHKCKCDFYLTGDEKDVNINEVFCVDCNADDVELIGYDKGNSVAITELMHRISDLADRIEDLENNQDKNEKVNTHQKDIVH